MNVCVVAGSGPSLTPAVAESCRSVPTIVVNDAYKLLPWAFALVASDASWWRVHHSDLDGFNGRRITPAGDHNSVEDLAGFRGWHVEPVALVYGYGMCSGFAAISYALTLGYTKILLTGFDMRTVGTQRHFFGQRTDGLRDTDDYHLFLPDFDQLARKLPDGVTITNTTPGSRLTCFPIMKLEGALK